MMGMMMLPFNPFSGLTAKIYGGVALLAIAVAGVQTVRIDGFWFIKGYAERLANSEKREGQLIAASEKNAQEQSRIMAENTAQQNQIERLNREKSQLNALAIRDATSRYADNNRLHKICPNIGGTDPAAKDSAAQGNDGLQADSIVVSKRDFDVLNGWAERGIQYSNWARELVAANLAVEGD